MPGNYEVLDHQPTVQVYGPNAIFDEQMLTMITKPTGIRAMALVSNDRSPLGLPPLDGVAHVPMSSFVLTNLGIGGYVPPGTTTPSQYVDAEYQRLVAIGGA